jgi:DNA-binding transcriptional ArsR family regulator
MEVWVMKRRILPSDTQGRQLSMHALFSVLNNDTRRELLGVLAAGEKDVASLAAEVELDMSMVSHALNGLLDAGLVSMRQEWRQHLYRLSDAVNAVIQKDRIAITVMGLEGNLQFELKISPEFSADKKAT